MQKSNKKGFTLVEVMVTLAISSIVIVAVLIAIQSFTGQFTSAKKRMDAKTAATLTLETIKSEIRLAKKANISLSLTDAMGCNMITSRGGRLFQTKLGSTEKDLMDVKNYYGFNCNVKFSKFDDSNVRVEIIIYDGTPTPTSLDTVSRPIYTLSRNVRLINTYDAANNFNTPTDIVHEVALTAPGEAVSILRYVLP